MIPHHVLVAVLLAATTCRHLVEAHGTRGVKFDPENPSSPENRFNDPEFVRNKEHLQEHMKGSNIDLEKASQEELDFHFFKLHDSNGDNRLDGLEILSSLYHAVEEQWADLMKRGMVKDIQHEYLAKVKEHLIGTTDKILEEEDVNKDGYLNYYEYSKSRKTSMILNRRIPS